MDQNTEDDTLQEGRWYPSPPPDDDLYVIYSIGDEERQEWPAELLDYSFRRSGQKGTLIRLVSGGHREEAEIPLTPNGYTLVTPQFYPELRWPVVNKVASLDLLMRKLGRAFCQRNAESVLLFLDPDMIFTHSWDPQGLVSRGKAFGQRWIGYGKPYCERSTDSVEWCPPSGEPCLMYPFAITVADMEPLAPLILKEALSGYQKCRDWMADMTAFVVAMAQQELKINAIENFGICNTWEESRNDKTAPILHYCQKVFDVEGNEIWNKGYTPWRRVPDPSLATNRVDREVLATVAELRVIKKALGKVAGVVSPADKTAEEST